MSIIHVRQIEAKLKSLFDNLIDLSDYANKPQSEQESAFLTRALAAFAILATADVTSEQAASCGLLASFGETGTARSTVQRGC